MGAKRLHVVTLIDSISRLGGAERLAAEIAMRLDQGRFRSTLCVTRLDSGQILDDASDTGVRVLQLGRHSTGSVWCFRRLVTYLKRERADILHSHLYGSNVWGAALGLLAGVPVTIAHEHGWSFEGQRVRRMVDKQIVARGATLILTASHHDRERMIGVEGIPPDKVDVLPLGIAPVADSQRDVRKELRIPPGAPVVGTVCALRPEKALDLLMEATAVLRKEFPDLHLLVVGEGDEEVRLRRLIGERGLAASVKLLGRWPGPDVPAFLAAVDVAVNCSDHESSPLAVLEYMRAAKPVVATRVGGTPELVQDGVHGVLVERRNPQALANAIGELLRNPAQRVTMGQRGRQRQQSEFDSEVMMHRLEAMYERLRGARTCGRRWQ